MEVFVIYGYSYQAGVRRAGLHCNSSLWRTRVYSFCCVCCALAFLFVENVTKL